MHAPDPTAVPDPPTLAARFAACTLPKGEWTHHAHLAVGLWHVAEYGADAALARLRDGIRRLNDSHGTPNTDGSGYHETMTCAYVRLLDQFLAICPRRDAHAQNARQLLASPIAHRDALLVAELDRDVGVRLEVVVPVRVVGRARLRREDEDAVALELAHQRRDALGAGLRTEVVDQHHRRALEGAPDLAAVRSELCDDLRVPVVVVGHGVSVRRVVRASGAALHLTGLLDPVAHVGLLQNWPPFAAAALPSAAFLAAAVVMMWWVERR